MPTVKKLIFAPFFLISLSILTFQLNPLLKSYDFIFSLSLGTLIQLVTLTGLILLSSFLFVLFATLAYEWKIVLLVALASALIPVMLINPILGLILSVGIVVSLLITYLGVENTLKSYLNFAPNSLFGPPIRQLTTLLILVISLVYFLSISRVIQKDGFQIPDSLIDTALKITQGQSTKQTENPQLSIPPDLLRQSGLDSLIKQTVKDQLQNVIKPYLGFVPIVLAVILFFLLQSLTSLLNLLIYPLLWIIFHILEKSGFIKFTIEQRSVKKMVIN